MAKTQFDTYEDHILLSPKTKAAYGMVGFGEIILNDVVTFPMVLFYNTILKVPITWVTWAFVGSRFWDAISDPLMGHISDNTRTRWGRRRPYILLGGILMPLCFCAMAIPPASLSQKGLFGYLAVIAFLYFTAYTITMVPAGGLGAELTFDYHERTRLNAYRGFLNRIGAIGASATWYLAGRFGDFRKGFFVIGLTYPVLSFLAFFTAFLGTRENVEVQTQEPVSFFKGMKATFSSRPFWMLAGMVFFLLLGILLGFPVGSYINIYYVYGGNSVAAGHVMFISGLVFNITCLIAVPIVASIGLRIGKERTMLVGMAIFTVAPFMSWFVFDPAHPYLQVLFQLPVAMALSCVMVYAGAMVADLVDLDEFVTYKRREGSYAAMISFIFKLAGPLGNLGFAYLLEYWAKFDETLDVQTPDTIFRMRLILMLVPLLPCAIAAVLAFLYPIREQQIREVRVLLEERRAKRLAEGRPPVVSTEE